MMGTRYKWWRAIATMRRAGVQLADGLRPGELSAVESYVGSRLPPDQRALLREVLPVGPGFPDWRDLGSEALRAQLELPFESLADNVRQGKFWWTKRWGRRPADAEEALAIVRRHYEKAPRLVPVYEQAYLPARPCEAYNPILAPGCGGILLSCASCLRKFLDHEFGSLSFSEALLPDPRPVRFWTALGYARMDYEQDEPAAQDVARRSRAARASALGAD